eukprot:CAMPEP_0194065884 /NCGR_PEP_ID=MMETSP0009_2-20130614/85716_1 /TAXON_ID=210454 /ORGANISM="Grammatophora oceanica, Strain CCMP 410" /LENGTH=241 /DNA_ID=CAMNT_0038718779 /DNA_START=1156 /DNA_END=1877 /DNA_ORIENTATION=+
MEFVQKDVLSATFDHSRHPSTQWPLRESVLQKYAAGQGQSGEFATSPIPTLMQFPIDSVAAFKECIEHYYVPQSSLPTFDSQGRLPIHVLLTSSNRVLNTPPPFCPSLELEPRSALVRNPTSGLFPYEAEALLLAAANDDHRRPTFGSNEFYMLFRADPGRALRTRDLVGCGDGSSCGSEEPTTGAALIPRTSGDDHTDGHVNGMIFLHDDRCTCTFAGASTTTRLGDSIGKGDSISSTDK